MNEPNPYTLPEKMHYAARIVEEATAREGLPGANPWSADRLRKYAEVWEAQDSAATEREDEAEELARAYFLAWCPHLNWPGDSYSPDRYRRIARELIESGWRKGDSE